MKCLACIASILLVCSVSHAQEGNELSKSPSTKLELFSAKTGIVVIKGYTIIGSVNGTGTVAVSARELRHANSSSAQQGVTIEVKEAGRLQRENISYIDYDEIDSLVQGIDYITRVDSSSTQMQNFEAAYRTKGDFSITTFNSRSGEISAAISSGTIGKTTAYLSIPELSKFRELLVKAKEKLPDTKVISGSRKIK